MKILVTGAGGFIGRHVVEEFVQLGRAVRATDLPARDLSQAAALGAEVVPGDLLNPDDVRGLLEGITHIVHCAATFNLGLPFETCLRVNRDAACLLCDEAGKRGLEQFLHLSTGGVYGGSVYTPMREDHPHHPPDAYSLSKEAGESAIVHRMREYGVPLTVFRPTAVYGPYSTYIAGAFYVLPSILRYYGIRKLPSFKGGKSLTLVHVKDITGAIAFCLDNPDAFGEDFNLAEDKPLVAGEFFDFLYGLFDIDVAFRLPYPKMLIEGAAKLALKLPAPVSFGPLNRVLERMWDAIVAECDLVKALKPHFDQDFMYFMLGNHYLDSSKLRGIGYVSRYPTCLEGLGETIEWYRKERWLP
ncbi:MAG: NAD(P)-dependent oxidoreductase [Actinobacteria bacterium]|nr:NAD(P)-dependent oxidoreductase [Actinomycetota bacterium]